MLFNLEDESNGGKKVMTERMRKVVVPAMPNTMFPTLCLWQFRKDELLFSYSDVRNNFNTRKFNLQKGKLDEVESSMFPNKSMIDVAYLK